MKEVLHSSLEFDTMSAARIVPFGPEWSRDNWKLQFEPQPWTIFSVDGQQRLIHQNSSPCESTRSLWETGMFLVMEGGQFFWPPVRVGFKRQINMMTSPSTDGKQQINSSMDTQGGGNTYSRRNVTLETLSVQPLILSVDDFFDDDECTYVRDAAQPKLKYSDSAIHDRDDGETFGWSRTGSSTIIRKIEPKLQSLTRRLAQLVRVHVTHLEPTTVSKYRIGEYYGPHHDYFEPTLYSGDPATIRLLENGLRNRMISIFWYLSDLPQQQQQQNGATSFPLVSKVPLDEACNTGLQVPPKKGKVVIMYNIHPDGSVDPNAINADCPVQRGVKWLTNLYVWNKPVLASRYA
jgi:prolyl 4-hydroxylase